MFTHENDVTWCGVSVCFLHIIYRVSVTFILVRRTRRLVKRMWGVGGRSSAKNNHDAWLDIGEREREVFLYVLFALFRTHSWGTRISSSEYIKEVCLCVSVCVDVSKV